MTLKINNQQRVGPEADPGTETQSVQSWSTTDMLLRDRGLGRDVTPATPVSGRGITGGGSGYVAILAHAE